MSGLAYVQGAAMIPFGKYRDSSYAGLAVPAVVAAIESSGVDKRDIQSVYFGHAYGGMLTAQRVCKEIGIGGIPTVNVDNACSGGATALYEAFCAVRSGEIEVALVVGVEKLTQFNGGTLPLPPEDREVRRGVVMPAVYAMRARRYLHETDANLQDLAAVSVKAHMHGAANPYAQLRGKLTVDDVLMSRPIADPLRLFMCCPTGDGAAAIVLVSERVHRRTRIPAVRILASVLHSGQVAEGYRDMTNPKISEDCARAAYEQAGVSPDDLDVIELHDAFSSAELMYYEALGLAPRGEGFRLIREDATTYGGQVVVNPSGGLLAKGHPVGASGVAQVVELYWQLTGDARDRQVEHARLGLAHVTGGGVSGLDHGSCTVHIFEAT